MPTAPALAPAGTDDGAHRADPAPAAPDALRDALLDSRQRWRGLVDMVADFAFETDADSRFVYISPDPALGWDVDTLIGQPTDLLLEPGAPGTFDPFRPSGPIRRRRAWIRRADGGFACLRFATAPLFDGAGRVVGTRGIGIDETEEESWEATTAATLRRGELLDHILWRMRQEVMAPRMMHSVLDSLSSALGAEGAAVIDVLGGGVVAGTGTGRSGLVLHRTGEGLEQVLPAAVRMLAEGLAVVGGATGPAATDAGPLDAGRDAGLDADGDTGVRALRVEGGRPLLTCPGFTRFGEEVGLALWRDPRGRAWDAEDQVLAGSATSIIRVVLEHGAIQREMARQARTDPLTGLLNRRAFLDEMRKRIERLDREHTPATLLFIDLDNLKPVNDLYGHQTGDEAIRMAAELLRRTFRPGDLLARLGGDEFGVWLDGTDNLTAAERADSLCLGTPIALGEILPAGAPPMTMSIGIATRDPLAPEDAESLIRRADQAMYAVKRSGRGRWLVSRAAPL